MFLARSVMPRVVTATAFTEPSAVMARTSYRVEFFVQIIPALYFICITLHQKLYTCQVICKVFENFSLRAEELIDKITKFYAYYNGGADNMINRKE